jgi:hypothetical protein
VEISRRLKAPKGSVGRTSEQLNYAEAGKLKFPASRNATFKSDKCCMLVVGKILKRGREKWKAAVQPQILLPVNLGVSYLIRGIFLLKKWRTWGIFD